ncbi:MAG TPA: STAS domain-containing protein [Roseiflexaceae bacterium]|nr:STAS domain-containing protein [Roseiflexaceae bacterium]
MTTDLKSQRRLNISLRMQLTIALSLFSLILLGSLAFSLASMRDIRNRMQQGIDIDGSLSRAANQVALNALQARRYEKDIFLSLGETAEYNAYRASWAQSHAALDQSIAAFKALATDEIDRQQAERWRGDSQSYQETMRNVLRRIEAGELRGSITANDALETGEGPIRELTETALRASEDKVIRARQSADGLIALTEQNTRVSLVLGGLAAVLVVALIIVTPRLLLGPVRSLQQATAQIAAGDYSQQVPASNTSEFAELAGSFNHMIGRIQQQIRELDQRALVEQQNQRLQELLGLVRALETPVIPLQTDALLVPLVGYLDATRAERIKQNVLESIHSQRARVVLLDITGIATVDETVAAFFQQIATGVRLLGASLMITGITPAVAQTLARMGVSLGLVETAGRLHDGVQRVIARGLLSSDPSRN